MNQPQLYLEDFKPDRVFEFEPVTIDKQEMLDFAREFDPQPMHLDEKAGSESMLGGLAASGWYTSAIFMRMMCERFLLDSSSEGSPGLDFIHWHHPVFAGDTLTGRSVVLESRPLRSRPGLGIAKFRHELENQRGEAVFLSENSIIFGMRDKAGAEQ